MKKLSLLIVLTVLALASCELEVKTYEKADLIGLWEQVDPIPEDSGCAEYSDLVEFTADDVKFSSICDGSESSITLAYDFDGKTVSYTFLLEISMKIDELTADKVIFTQTVQGFDESETVEYRRIQ